MKPAAHPSSPTNNWSLPYGIVLAGGVGDRLRAVTEGWQGEHRPKQFCTFTGTRSMLQHTLDRVKTVVPHHNVFTVITSGQERFLPDALNTALPGRIFTQPADRGTAAAVLLPLTAIYERDPEAAVMIFPCDHFVYPEGRFLEYVVATYRLCRRFRQSLVVLHAIRTGVVDRDQETIAAEQVYQRIESASFSSDLMQRATESTLLFPMQDVQWSDWGRAKRVAATLRQLGLRTPAPVAQAL